MKGIGVDIIDLERLDIENVHFVKRVLSDKEYQLFLQMEDKRKMK